VRFPTVLLVMIAISPLAPAKENAVLTDFVRQHLNAIGSEQARSALKNRVVKGSVAFHFVTGSPQRWGGDETFASTPDKIDLLMQFPPSVFLTEHIVRDGKKTSVAQTRPGRWSRFGLFVKVHNEILTEGLFGGTLSAAWPLIDLEKSAARLEDRGIKKIDGRELRRIDYIPKQMTDLDIQLYFEPDTFRHVQTIYLLHEQPLDRIQEQFANFVPVEGLMLPTRWTIQLESRSGQFARFEIIQQKAVQNVTLDPGTFDVK
jgi:hypothetical protein